MDFGASRLTVRNSAEFGGGIAVLPIDPLLAPLGREGPWPGSPLLPHGADL
ncbi:MAG: hypothetical protein OSB05_08305 [Akkermansiaceae bacterium]|nr:hypothetical protein [Akkermansiaceae bacterium]